MFVKLSSSTVHFLSTIVIDDYIAIICVHYMHDSYPPQVSEFKDQLLFSVGVPRERVMEFSCGMYRLSLQ